MHLITQRVVLKWNTHSITCASLAANNSPASRSFSHCCVYLSFPHVCTQMDVCVCVIRFPQLYREYSETLCFMDFALAHTYIPYYSVFSLHDLNLHNMAVTKANTPTYDRAARYFPYYLCFRSVIAGLTIKIYIFSPYTQDSWTSSICWLSFAPSECPLRSR